MKAHIGMSGTGTRPLCGADIFRTSGYTVPRAEFVKLSDSFKCKRCEKKSGTHADKLTPEGCCHRSGDVAG